MNGPPPLSLGDILGSVLAQNEWERREAERQTLDEQAMFASAYALARQLAPILRVGEADIFQALGYVPDNMLGLLRTPEGWAALAAIVAADFGVPTVTFEPTIN